MNAWRGGWIRDDRPGTVCGVIAVAGEGISIMCRTRRAVGLALGLGLVLAPVAATLAAGSASAAPVADGVPGDGGSGLGSVGDLVSGLAGGAGTLGFLLPSPNGSGLIGDPAAASTGTPDSILPYGLLDGGKPQPL
jgi:hypothetical protein